MDLFPDKWNHQNNSEKHSKEEVLNKERIKLSFRKGNQDLGERNLYAGREIFKEVIAKVFV